MSSQEGDARLPPLRERTSRLALCPVSLTQIMALGFLGSCSYRPMWDLGRQVRVGMVIRIIIDIYRFLGPGHCSLLHIWLLKPHSNPGRWAPFCSKGP